MAFSSFMEEMLPFISTMRCIHMARRSGFWMCLDLDTSFMPLKVFTFVECWFPNHGLVNFFSNSVYLDYVWMRRQSLIAWVCNYYPGQNLLIVLACLIDRSHSVMQQSYECDQFSVSISSVRYSKYILSWNQLNAFSTMKTIQSY